MKFGQLTRHIFFFQKLCKKCDTETSSRPLFVFWKSFILRWKQVVCSLVSISFENPQLGMQKNKLCKNLSYGSRDMLKFDFLEKDLGIVSSPHFVYDFSRKMFFTLCSINWPNFMSGCIYFLRYWAVCIWNSLLPRLWRHKFWS